jgi:hypothetical protein
MHVLIVQVRELMKCDFLLKLLDDDQMSPATFFTLG